MLISVESNASFERVQKQIYQRRITPTIRRSSTNQPGPTILTVRALCLSICCFLAFPCVLSTRPAGTAPFRIQLALVSQTKRQAIYLAHDYPSLQDAVSAMPPSPVTLAVTFPLTLSVSLRIPANITLEFADTGSVLIGAGQSLTIQGPLVGPANRIFLGEGTVSLAGNNLKPTLLPEWWGAVGNKTQDDSRAIQSALTVAESGTPGATVHLGSAHYLSTEALRIESNVSLTGSGPNSELFFENRLGIPSAIQIANATSVEISDLKITGSYTTPTVSRLISINASSHISVRRCLLSGANLRPASGQISAIAFENSSDLWIEDNDISKDGPVTATPFGVEVGGYLLGGANIHVRRNHIEGSTTIYGIHLVDASYSDALDNYVDGGNKDAADNHSGYGITFYQLSPGNKAWIEISGNTVLNCAGDGIYAAGFDHVTVQRNRVLNVAQKQEDMLLGVGGISLNVTNYATVNGNVVKRSGKAGLVLANTSHVAVANNTIEDIQSSGIWLREIEQDTSLTDNTIDTSAEAGIRVTKPNSRLRLSGNQISNTGTWGIIVASILTDGNISDNSISNVATGGGIFVGGGTNNVLHHNETSGIHGSGIDYEGASGTIDHNHVVGIDPANTLYGIAAAGAKLLLIEVNDVSKCLQGINVGAGGGVVRNNILNGNSTPVVLFPGTLSTGNIPPMR